jgi:HAD superfamily hydrolase (TIGR01509 family)
MLIAFDLMDTLVTDPYRVATEAATGMTFARFEELRPPGVYFRLERGEIEEELYWDSLRQHGVPVQTDVFHATRRAGYCPIPGMAQLLADCRRVARVVIASNYPVWIEEVMCDVLGWPDLPCYASYTCGVRKPSPLFFEGLCQAYGVAPSELVLVDDKNVNVTAVHRIGGTGILFRSAAGTRRRLRECCGLLSGPRPE